MGELSEATGLSVRVLRHWEQLGLVSPARTRSGHRRYGPEEITRLYRAMALRRTGLGLRQVAALLAQEDPDPAATLLVHLNEIEDDLHRCTELRDRLASVFAGAAPGARAANVLRDPQLLMKVIETMTMFEQYVHGYHSQENRRLHDQAGTLVDLLHDGITFPPGSTVLEAGCGVGAQTVALAHRSPDARITASTSPPTRWHKLNAVSPAATRQRPLPIADVYDLRTPAHWHQASFDHVFVCFLLEHLPRPVEALDDCARCSRPAAPSPSSKATTARPTSIPTATQRVTPSPARSRCSATPAATR